MAVIAVHFKKHVASGVVNSLHLHSFRQSAEPVFRRETIYFLFFSFRKLTVDHFLFQFQKLICSLFSFSVSQNS